MKKPASDMEQGIITLPLILLIKKSVTLRI